MTIRLTKVESSVSIDADDDDYDAGWEELVDGDWISFDLIAAQIKGTKWMETSERRRPHSLTTHKRMILMMMIPGERVCDTE